MIKYTHDDFLNKLQNVNPNLEVLDKYIKSSVKIRFKCLIDECVFEATPNNVLRGHGCPICGRKVGAENSRKSNLQESFLLINKRPNLSKSLIDIEDAYNYGYKSTRILKWKCHDCGCEFEKSPNKFSEDYLVCPNCIKNESYPNKFMFNLLSQLEIDFIKEYSPEWANKKRYDFYFKVNSFQYIVEMDGGFHRSSEVKTIDVQKDYMAAEHNIRMIRINCDYNKIVNRFEHIKYEISESEFSKLFDISEEMYENADKFALTSECVYISKLWLKHKDVEEIKNITQLSLLTIRRYLRFAAKNGMCDYDKDKEHAIRRKKSIDRAEFARSIPVKCNETGEIFPNMKYAGLKYKCNVSSYFYQNRKTAGVLDDGTKLTWSKISRDEFLKYYEENSLAS